MAALRGLFATETLAFLPDETLFSFASRYHIASGATRPENTARRLFGDYRGGQPHDLPAFVGHFADVFHGDLGSAEDIALERTILPYYLAFRDEVGRTQIIRSLIDGKGLSVKAFLGLNSHASGSAPLKACSQCLEIDHIRHGVGYWHRAHQWPGVWLCSRHPREALKVCTSTESTTSGIRWALPGQIKLTAPPHESSLICSAANLVAVATVMVTTLSRAHSPAASALLVAICQTRVLQAPRRGEGRDARSGHELYRWQRQLAELPETRSLPKDPIACERLLRTIIAGKFMRVPTFRLMCALAWAADSSDQPEGGDSD